MLDFPRWKVIWIWLLLLAGVALAIPSLMPERVAKQLHLDGMSRINLGLDLQGGSHLLLEADTADLAKQNLQKMEDTIRTEMRRGDPKISIGDISTSNGQLSFLVRDVSQLDAAVERARAQTQAAGLSGQRDWEVTVADSTRELRELAEELTEVLALWAAGTINPRIDGTYPFTKAADAHRRILSHGNTGKIVLIPD